MFLLLSEHKNKHVTFTVSKIYIKKINQSTSQSLITTVCMVSFQAYAEGTYFLTGNIQSYFEVAFPC